MKNLQRVLVAIKNPATRRQPALRKAAQLAQGSGATLELFHAISTPVYLDAFALQGKSLAQVQEEWRGRELANLEKLAAPLRKAGLTVNVESTWDFPAYEGIIRRAQRIGADLIVAEQHPSRHRLPSLLRFNDWELLRLAPVPVLVVKRPLAWRRPVVLAAIDPTHAFAKPAKLDEAILSAASLAAWATGGKLHVVHAWPGALPQTVVASTVSAQRAADAIKQARREARAAFAAAVERSGVVGARKHFVDGHAVDVIPTLARKLRAGVVVMGAISRSGIKRLVIGNVAEQVLDGLASDVLVVKPAEFKPRVPARGRGVRLIPTPPYI